MLGTGGYTKVRFRWFSEILLSRGDPLLFVKCLGLNSKAPQDGAILMQKGTFPRAACIIFVLQVISCLHFGSAVAIFTRPSATMYTNLQSMLKTCAVHT